MTERLSRLMIPALTLSAFGGWLHNTLEGLPTGSVETISAIVPPLVLAGWWRKGGSDVLWWITLGWVLVLSLVVGAILSVLPLPVWPYYPEQSLSHYLAHLGYALTQIPALVILWRMRVPRAVTI